MVKNKNIQKREVSLANPKGKTVEELKQIAQTLQLQLNQEQVLLSQDQTTVQNRQSKILRLQGGLEVTLQLIPKEEEEARNNGEINEG